MITFGSDLGLNDRSIVTHRITQTFCVWCSHRRNGQPGFWASMGASERAADLHDAPVPRRRTNAEPTEWITSRWDIWGPRPQSYAPPQQLWNHSDQTRGPRRRRVWCRDVARAPSPALPGAGATTSCGVEVVATCPMYARPAAGSVFCRRRLRGHRHGGDVPGCRARIVPTGQHTRSRRIRPREACGQARGCINMRVSGTQVRPP